MDKTELEELLENHGRDGLLKLISEISEAHPGVEKWLISYCSEHGVKKKELLTGKAIEAEWDSVWFIVEEANDYGGTSERKEETVYDALYRIQEQKGISKVPWSLRKSIVDSMMEQFLIGNSGFDDILHETAEVLCCRKEEKLHLAELISQRGGYYAGIAADLYLEAGDCDSYVRLKRDNLEYGKDYVQLADYYLSEGDNESALDLISKGFQECRTGRADLYEWQLGWYAQRNMRKQMLQLYRKAVKNNDSAQAVTELMYRFSADYEEKKKYLLDMIRLCYPNDVKRWYLECRDVLSADDFRNAHKELMAILKKADPEEYVNQCFEEENYAEALRTLQSRPRGRFGFEIDRDCSLLRRLAETHPEEAAELWFEKCRDLCLVSNQEKYREAAGMLRNIKSLMISFHLEDEWKTEFAQFMEENKKKRSLMKIIAQEPDLNE